MLQSERAEGHLEYGLVQAAHLQTSRSGKLTNDLLAEPMHPILHPLLHSPVIPLMKTSLNLRPRPTLFVLACGIASLLACQFSP